MLNSFLIFKVIEYAETLCAIAFKVIKLIILGIITIMNRINDRGTLKNQPENELMLTLCVGHT